MSDDDTPKGYTDMSVAYTAGFLAGKQEADARIAELEAALKPFDQYDESRCYLVGGFVDVKVKLADLRAARAAYLGEKDD